MKLHELDLTEDKVYSTNYYYKLIEWKVSYCGNLISQDEVECCITKLFDLKELLKIEFTEVIEPVNFLTAYKDSINNKSEYKTTSGTGHMKTNIHGHIIIIFIKETGIVNLNTEMWIKQ